jgi:hypothetical protein
VAKMRCDEIGGGDLSIANHGGHGDRAHF